MSDPQPDPGKPQENRRAIQADGEVVVLDENNALQLTPEEDQARKEFHRQHVFKKYGRYPPFRPPEPPPPETT